MLFLWMDNVNGEVTREIELGKIIHGLNIKNERPLNCYISPDELNKLGRQIPFLDRYLIKLQSVLKPGGRIVIK